MKKSSLTTIGVALGLFLSCQNTPNSTQQEADSLRITDEHTSQNSLDWAGIYQDTVPCADCPGIFTTVKLYEDGTYAYIAEYIDRNTTVQDSGRFMWHNNGSIVHLKGNNVDEKYKVGENMLLPVDEEGNVIQSELIDQMTLHKVN